MAHDASSTHATFAPVHAPSAPCRRIRRSVNDETNRNTISPTTTVPGNQVGVLEKHILVVLQMSIEFGAYAGMAKLVAISILASRAKEDMRSTKFGVPQGGGIHVHARLSPFERKKDCDACHGLLQASECRT